MKTIHLERKWESVSQEPSFHPPHRETWKENQGSRNADIAVKLPAFSQINMARSGSKAPQTEEQRRGAKAHAEGRRAFLSRCSHALLCYSSRVCLERQMDGRIKILPMLFMWIAGRLHSFLTATRNRNCNQDSTCSERLRAKLRPARPKRSRVCAPARRKWGHEDRSAGGAKAAQPLLFSHPPLPAVTPSFQLIKRLHTLAHKYRWYFSFPSSKQHQHQCHDCDLRSNQYQSMSKVEKADGGLVFQWRGPLILRQKTQIRQCRRPYNSGASDFRDSAEDRSSQSNRLIVCDSAHCKWDTFPYNLHDPLNWLSLKTLSRQSEGFYLALKWNRKLMEPQWFRLERSKGAVENS